MKWLWITLAVLAVLVVLVLVVGALLPKAHVAARALRLPVPPKDVFLAITDVATLPSWRKDVTSVEWLPDRDGKRVYREVSGFGPIEFAIERSEPDRLHVTRIVTPDSPFGGTWTFVVTPDGTGSRLAITEHGEVHNVLFRFLSRFVFGHTATLDGYLRALAGKFGAAAQSEACEPAALPR